MLGREPPRFSRGPAAASCVRCERQHSGTNTRDRPDSASSPCGADQETWLACGGDRPRPVCVLRYSVDQYPTEHATCTYWHIPAIALSTGGRGYLSMHRPVNPTPCVRVPRRDSGGCRPCVGAGLFAQHARQADTHSKWEYDTAFLRDRLSAPKKQDSRQRETGGPHCIVAYLYPPPTAAVLLQQPYTDPPPPTYEI